MVLGQNSPVCTKRFARVLPMPLSRPPPTRELGLRNRTFPRLALERILCRHPYPPRVYAEGMENASAGSLREVARLA